MLVSPFPIIFSKGFLFGSLKVWIVWYRVRGFGFVKTQKDVTFYWSSYGEEGC